ncbi:MAG: ATP-binding protein [Sphingomicrobium sp.]
MPTRPTLTIGPPTKLQISACVIVVVVTLLVLFGWATEDYLLTSTFSKTKAMNPVTCCAILALAWAILLRSRRTDPFFYALAVGAVLIGATKLLELTLGAQSSIDQLLFVDQLDSVPGLARNRMAANTAVGIITLGLALLASRRNSSRVQLGCQILCLIAAGTALTALIGYFFGLIALYQIHASVAMALPTAITQFILALAIISLNPEFGVMRIFPAAGRAKSLTLFALPIAVILPVLVGMLGLVGQRAGYYGPEAAVVIELIVNAMLNIVLVGACAIAIYVSDAERDRREATIRNSEKQFREAEEAGNVGHWKVEMPSRVVRWSDGLLKICGLHERVLPDIDTALSTFHPEDRELVRNHLLAAKKEGKDWELACRICRPDGSIRHVITHGVCERNELGETSEVLVVTSDVTDLEIARRGAEAAKVTTATFLTNMSHEIRTPMNGIMGFVELLLESDLDIAQRRHLTLVQESSLALLKLLNDILDISKMEAGRFEIVETRYNIRHGIKQCARLMTPIAEQKGIALKVAIADDLPSHLMIDGLRMRQIVLNLIANAIKFTRSGAISVVIAKGVDDAGTATLRALVEDSSIGIPPDRVATILETFVQAELSTTRRFGGSGLGLSISRQLAELMDGSIEVDSVVGKGTKMTVVLPLIEASASVAHVAIAGMPDSAQQAPPRTADFTPASILLVEDVDINQELFAEMLTRLGHKFQIASDGAQAVELAGKLATEPDAWNMILMDLQMPVMDGLAATQEIRSFGGRAATIPIIALTASAFEQDRRQCECAGMDDHITKPVGIEALGGMIDRWHSGTTAPVSATDAAQPAPSTSINQRLAKRLTTSAARLGEIVREVMRTNPDKQKTLMIEAGKIAHMLSGTAGMIGLPETGEIAAVAEGKIKACVDVTSAADVLSAIRTIENLVAALIVSEVDTSKLTVLPQAKVA